MGTLRTAIPLLAQLLDEILPDKDAADAAKLELVKLAQQAHQAVLEATVAISTAQAETNKVEAASNRLFVAGSRPFVGWICGLSIGFKFIGGPIRYVVAQGFGHPIDLHEIDTSELWVMLAEMLGLGGLRTFEKVKDAA